MRRPSYNKHHLLQDLTQSKCFISTSPFNSQNHSVRYIQIDFLCTWGNWGRKAKWLAQSEWQHWVFKSKHCLYSQWSLTSWWAWDSPCSTHIFTIDCWLLQTLEMLSLRLLEWELNPHLQIKIWTYLWLQRLHKLTSVIISSHWERIPKIFFVIFHHLFSRTTTKCNWHCNLLFICGISLSRFGHLKNCLCLPHWNICSVPTVWQLLCRFKKTI